MDTLNSKQETQTAKFEIKQLVRFFIFSFITPGTVLIAGWDIAWVMGWILILVIGLSSVVGRLVIYRKNPSLLYERGNYRKQKGIKRWDMPMASIVGLFGPLAIWITAGLDHTFGWSAIPLVIQWTAVVAFIFSVLFSNWALVVNPYFSAVVRIQKDRGHTTVTDGPYSIVRHPGYAGGVIGDLAMTLMLGSLWALIPAFMTVIVLILRTAKEDQTLIKELPGYAKYAQQTKYRLFPGIW
jgi:protein-S-isoprenylcysteine O-methyltransferase Ste14